MVRVGDGHTTTRRHEEEKSERETVMACRALAMGGSCEPIERMNQVTGVEGLSLMSMHATMRQRARKCSRPSFL